MFLARVAELVDATDLKSVDLSGRVGSSPTPGTKLKSLLVKIFIALDTKNYSFF